jgi:hypothetical protein
MSGPRAVLGDDVMMKNDDMTVKDRAGTVLGFDSGQRSDRASRAQTFTYFSLAILGFSFWFFMAVPFASHRESYGWLAGVHNDGFAGAFGVISVTYRPLAQATAWLGFLILNPSVFPTSILRQALLQGFIYAMFVFAWWLIYRSALQRRLFALIAFVTGGVFFSGYVHLFHIYGIFYAPVMLTLGAVFRSYARGGVERREVWLAVVGILLVFWHPFATALFLGFYFGSYLDSFWCRSIAQHIQAVVILLVGAVAILAMVVMFSRADVMVPLNSKLFGFLESYRTTEVNAFASFVAFVLTQLGIFSMGLSGKVKWTAVFVVSALSVVFFLRSLPLLLLWLCVVLMKLLRLRCWSLCFLMVSAALLPLGAGIGGPVSALFAVIVAGYVTALGWSRAEEALSFVKTGYVTVIIIASAMVILMVRAGIDVPIVTRAASPLLTERERTYQLEKILAWLHDSQYCGYEVAFAESAGSPIDSAENVITRRYRPPAALGDVRLFWDTVLRCPVGGGRNDKDRTATVTFGGPQLAESRPVFKVEGRYAGAATIWIRDSQK